VEQQVKGEYGRNNKGGLGCWEKKTPVKKCSQAGTKAGPKVGREIKCLLNKRNAGGEGGWRERNVDYRTRPSGKDVAKTQKEREG